MRTRLASLIVVKQEPISNDYLDSEQDVTIHNFNDVDSQFYGLSNRREFYQNTSGDLNNNQEEFDDDKKCMYFFVVYSFFCFPFGSHFSFEIFIFFFIFWLFFYSVICFQCVFDNEFLPRFCAQILGNGKKMLKVLLLLQIWREMKNLL